MYSPDSSSSSVTLALQPMSLGKLLDRSLKLTPHLFSQKWVTLLVMAVLSSMSALNDLVDPGSLGSIRDPEALKAGLHTLSIIGSAGSGILGLYLSIVITRLAAQKLKYGRIDKKQRKPVTLRLLFKLFLFYMGYGAGVGLFLILLIWPGIKFALSRFIGSFILIIEDTSTNEAFERSKQLMKPEPWYKLSKPKIRLTGIFLVLQLMNMLVLASGAAALLGMLGLPIIFFGSILGAFLLCFNSAVFASFYFDLVARYEGSDIRDAVGSPNLS